MLNITTRPVRPTALACASFALLFVASPAAMAADPLPGSPPATTPSITQLQQQLDALRQQYEGRIKALEDKLTQAQQAAPAASSDAATAPPQPTPSSRKGNAFNPAIAVVLNGTYVNLSQNPDTWGLSGFWPGGEELGPGERGFSLGESEITLSANVDSWLYGALTLAVSPEETIEVEEAYVQTTALPAGLRLKAGRFLAGVGYLNAQHAHTWDFVDAPYTHQAFLGGQYKQEGLQATWLLPTDQFIELGAELGQGKGFPGTDRQRNGLGALSLSAHTGGDVGDNHSWRAGVSWLRTKAQDRTWDTTDAMDQDVTNAFTGQSKMWVLDGVWKWAPDGNATRTSFKLQGEYFRRTEAGQLTYAFADPAALGLVANTDGYRSTQSGWYLQGVYQFMKAWRVGLRHDQLDSGKVNLQGNAANLVTTDHQPRRTSLMLDWGPSEFQRWRLQVSDDRARQGVRDTQLFLQYQMNLGAHGAHSY